VKDETSLFKAKLKEFKQICKEKGIKLTHQRMEIFHEITISEEHPSAEEIHKRLKPRLPMISLDTVYRTLSILEQYGIIARVQVLDDRGRFDGNLTPHHHLVCTKCKCIHDFYWPVFNEMELPPETGQWGKINSTHVEIRGICENCMKNKYDS